MSALPVPDLMRRDIYALAPEDFTARGIRLVFLDVDNTLAPYTVREASARMIAWAEEMKRAGLTLYILSNNRGDRPKNFAAALGLPYRKRARKPFPKAAREVLAEKGVPPGAAAFIGDQVYTDVLCAKRCGALAVLVEPIEFTHFWLRLRYWAEAPFRILGKRRQKHDENRKDPEETQRRKP